MLWLWCIDRNIILSSAHIAGSENLTADRLSRDRNIDKEWKLNIDIFHQISYNYGVPCIDLFASRINKQTVTYVSYYRDSQAVAIDAFTISWSFNLCYIFAPISIMGQVLKKLQEDQGEAVVICPLWATQPWFPLLLGMIVEDSYILPQTSKLLYLPQDPDRQHPLRKMRLEHSVCQGSPGEFRHTWTNSRYYP